MVTIYKTKTKIKKRSNARPRSLILHIPANIRDIMEFEHNTQITMEVCLNAENKKYIKIYKD